MIFEVMHRSLTLVNSYQSSHIRSGQVGQSVKDDQTDANSVESGWITQLQLM